MIVSLAEAKERIARAYRYRWPVGPVLLACLAAGLAGLLLPTLPSGQIGDDEIGSLLAAAPAAPEPDDGLEGFLAMRRWGGSADGGADDAEANGDAAAELDPTAAALLEIGFVGVTFVEDEYAVLIDLSVAAAPSPPDDASSDTRAGIVRLLAGDTLPDGRTLAAIEPDALTLATPDGGKQELRLFGDWDDASGS